MLKMALTLDDDPGLREEHRRKAVMDSHAATIVCADDDPEILGVLREYLTRQGFNVMTAANGVEALLQVARWLPQAVILDLFMPRLGGLEALDRIKRLVPGIVIVLISGVANALEMVAEAGTSVAGSLKKPLDLRHLLGLLVEAGMAPPAPPKGAPRPTDSAGQPRTRARVLVVDDDSEIRGALTTYLHGKGLEVLEAAGGEEALQRIPEFRPDIILLDIAMPGLSGIETLRRIHATPVKTSVVVVSGIEDYKTARQTLALGASDYVTKPVDFTYLDSVLEARLVTRHFEAGATERSHGKRSTSLSRLDPLPSEVANERPDDTEATRQ